MLIEKISLFNFRNFIEQEVTLFPGVNVFYGENAQGKTNFLEGIYLCSMGRSWRTHYDREMIRFNQPAALLRMLVSKDHIKDTISVQLKRDEQKNILLNGVKTRKLGELLGTSYLVVFSPDDLRLIKSGPAERRRFMDVELCQLSKLYYAQLKQYYHILKQRNAALKAKGTQGDLKSLLPLWDSQLIESGIKIYRYRNDFIEKISGLAGALHHQITGGKEQLEIRYKPSATPEDFGEKMEKSLEKDMFTGATAYGIHKDDLLFTINGEDTKIYGSQGQTRTASLCAKLAEIQLIHEETDIYPILLLDDVLSELDESRQHFLLDSILPVQTLLTCTGLEDAIRRSNENYSVFLVKNGLITFENGKSMV